MNATVSTFNLQRFKMQFREKKSREIFNSILDGETLGRAFEMEKKHDQQAMANLLKLPKVLRLIVGTIF